VEPIVESGSGDGRRKKTILKMERIKNIKKGATTATNLYLLLKLLTKSEK